MRDPAMHGFAPLMVASAVRCPVTTQLSHCICCNRGLSVTARCARRRIARTRCWGGVRIHLVLNLHALAGLSHRHSVAAFLVSG